MSDDAMTVEAAEHQDAIVKDLKNRFTYHAPKGTQPERYVYLREQALYLAIEIMRNCPECRERSRAFNKLEEALMLVNAGIARNE